MSLNNTNSNSYLVVAGIWSGAFEDEDDMDVYAVDSMSRYNRVLDEPDDDHNHGWTKPKHNRGKCSELSNEE